MFSLARSRALTKSIFSCALARALTKSKFSRALARARTKSKFYRALARYMIDSDARLARQDPGRLAEGMVAPDYAPGL